MTRRTELIICLAIFLTVTMYGWQKADAWVSPVTIFADPCNIPGSRCESGGKRKHWIDPDGNIGDNVDGTSTDSTEFVSTVMPQLWTDVDGDGKADADDSGSSWATQFTHTLSGAGLQQIQIQQNIGDDTVRLSTQSTIDIRVGNDSLGYTTYQITGLAGFYLLRYVITSTNTGDAFYRNVWPYATSGISAYMNGDGYHVDIDGAISEERVMSDGSIVNFLVNRKPGT